EGRTRPGHAATDPRPAGMRTQRVGRPRRVSPLPHPCGRVSVRPGATTTVRGGTGPSWATRASGNQTHMCNCCPSRRAAFGALGTGVSCGAGGLIHKPRRLGSWGFLWCRGEVVEFLVVPGLGVRRGREV